VPNPQSAATAAVPTAPARKIAKKRVEPKPVDAVVIGNVRYEVVASGKARGLSQDGGIIRAININNGAELWSLTVYEVKFDTAIEIDKQEIYITQLKAASDGKSLVVETKRGKRYRVDLQSRAVVAMF
jgi:outer membrane protein assembly factor BamB